MIFRLFEISYIILIAVCVYGFFQVVGLEDLYIKQTDTTPPAWMARRKWKYVAVIILSTFMVGMMMYLNWRTGKIIDGIMIQRPYPIHIQSQPVNLEVQHPAKPTIQLNQTRASYYDYALNGDPNYSRTHLVAASNVYPRGSMVEVCADKCVIVRINDYGPNPTVFPDRQIDLSSFAFKQLSPISRGVIEVKTRQIK